MESPDLQRQDVYHDPRETTEVERVTSTSIATARSVDSGAVCYHPRQADELHTRALRRPFAQLVGCRRRDDHVQLEGRVRHATVAFLLATCAFERAVPSFATTRTRRRSVPGSASARAFADRVDRESLWACVACAAQGCCQANGPRFKRRGHQIGHQERKRRRFKPPPFAILGTKLW